MSTRAMRLQQLLASGTLKRAQDPASSQSNAPATNLWTRSNLSGRLTEISGVGAVASLTAAIGLVLQTQYECDPVAWVTTFGLSFYPPDVSDFGVDLASLAVVRVPTARNVARAAERLVRSGAFGLVVLDLGEAAYVPIPLQGRLVGLAQKHDTAIVCLTEKQSDAPSLGSMVSLRAEILREPVTTPSGALGAQPSSSAYSMYRCKVKVLKDKRRGPNWSHEEVVRGPAGMR